MNHFIKLLRAIYGNPKPYNVLCELGFKYKKVEQIIEFQILAYNKKEAILVAKNLILKFNKENACHIKFDILWKINTNVNYKKNGISQPIESILRNRIKFNQNDLESLVMNSSFKKLEEEFDYVFKTDNPTKDIRN